MLKLILSAMIAFGSVAFAQGEATPPAEGGTPTEKPMPKPEKHKKKHDHDKKKKKHE